MIVKVPIIFESEESKFKEIYDAEFIDQDIGYSNIPVIFGKKDFFHICFEKGKEGIEKQKFGIRRARRLLVLKYILFGRIPSELRFEPETGNYCLLCEELDFITYLTPNPKDKNLLIGSIIHFGEGHTKMIQKQKDKTKPVSKIDFYEK